MRPVSLPLAVWELMFAGLLVRGWLALLRFCVATIPAALRRQIRVQGQIIGKVATRNSYPVTGFRFNRVRLYPETHSLVVRFEEVGGAQHTFASGFRDSDEFRSRWKVGQTVEVAYEKANTANSELTFRNYGAAWKLSIGFTLIVSVLATKIVFSIALYLWISVADNAAKCAEGRGTQNAHTCTLADLGLTLDGWPLVLLPVVVASFMLLRKWRSRRKPNRSSSNDAPHT